MYKIKKIDELALICKKIINNKKKIVLCHGVFDLIHPGHVNHFKEAKKNGDFLIVSVTKDEYVNKGPNRPIYNIDKRINFLAELSIIDYVCVSPSESAVDVIKILKPSFYVKGPDYKNFKSDITKKIEKENDAVKSVGGKVIITGGFTFSSSKIINDNFNILSESQYNQVQRIKKKFNFEGIFKILNSIKSLKVLVIGETIIDKYNFCQALGKSGKEPVLMLQELYSEQYLGGAAAIARHISTFAKKVSLLSMVGENSEHEEYILKKLEKNIKPYFVKKTESPTIVKTRFIDSINLNKIFGTYLFNDEEIKKKDEKKLTGIFQKHIKDHDLVIISDYGHGMISQKFAKLICKLSNFVAVNAQINAANIGYHSLNKYSNIDCGIINLSELKYEFRNKIDKTEFLLKKLSKNKRIRNAIVTQGKNGAIMYNLNKNKYYYSEAFASKVVDKIGAGDTMMAMVASILRINKDNDLALFLGSLAGAQSVETIGNSQPLNKIKLLKTIEYLFK
jgi:rfaE bifunctional protein kinase chain/domain/rfaE bifunctional protein nucleotidyltransferase chain/domain